MLFIVAFFIVSLFSMPVLSAKTHGIPPEVHNLPPEKKEKFTEAYKLYENHEYKESKRLFQDIEDRATKVPEIYFYLGEIEEALGNTPEAEMYLIQYMNLAPKKVAPYLKLASFYYEHKKLEKTREILDKAEKAEFEDPYYNFLIYNRLGVTYYFLQNYTQSESHFQKALENKDVYGDHPHEYVDTAYQLAKVCTSEGDIAKDRVIYEDALDVLSQIEPLTKKDDLFFKIYALRGYINGKLKNYTEAEDDFEKALGVKEFDIITRRNLKRIQEMKGEALDRTFVKWAGRVVAGFAVLFLVLVVTSFFNINTEVKEAYRKIIKCAVIVSLFLFGIGMCLLLFHLSLIPVKLVTLVTVVSATFLCLRVVALFCERTERIKDEKTMCICVIIAFVVIFIGITLPYITYIKWGEFEMNMQNPATSESIRFEVPK